MDRQTVLWILGESPLGLNGPLTAKDPDAPLVLPFDLGDGGTRYVLEFRGDRVTAVRREPLPQGDPARGRRAAEAARGVDAPYRGFGDAPRPPGVPPPIPAPPPRAEEPQPLH